MSMPIVPMATTQYFGPRRFDRCFIDLTGDSEHGAFIRALVLPGAKLKSDFNFRGGRIIENTGLGQVSI